MTRRTRQIVAFVLTLTIFTMIYRRVSPGALVTHFAAMDLLYLYLAVAMLAASSLLSIERLRWLVAGSGHLSFGSSTRIFLAASPLNLVLPSKIGDLGKAVFLRQDDVVSLERGGSIMILEKLLDLSSLCLLSAVGVLCVQEFDPMTVTILIFSVVVIGVTLLFMSADHESNLPVKLLSRLLQGRAVLGRIVPAVTAFARELRSDTARIAGVLAMSVLQWSLHLIQVYLFFMALRTEVPLAVVMALVPLALIVGMLPVTLGGMGTRDATLIAVFSAYAPTTVTAGVGLLVSLRLCLLSAIGLPFLRQYVSMRGTADV